MPRYTQAEIREFEQMRYEQQHKDEKPTHLETPIDLVVVDRQSRKVELSPVYYSIYELYYDLEFITLFWSITDFM